MNNNADSLQQLIGALGIDDSGVRSRAATALGWLGDQRAVEPLVRLLKDHDWTIRSSATSALGHLGKLATPKLVSLLRAEDSELHGPAKSKR
jgi:bilin biosynthesis protein